MQGSQLRTVVSQLLEARDSVPAERCVLTAITGIDGCGKSYVAERLARALEGKGMSVATINADGWLNLPGKRFNQAKPAEHFYDQAIRFEEMFSQLVLPLRDRRSLRIEMDYVEETAREYRRHTYEFNEVDVILLEGIFLLKRDLRSHYDLSIWIECSFETALERAMVRAQEGLSPEETGRAYRTIYFPAQELHFLRDSPRSAAELIINNDPRLGPVSGRRSAGGSVIMRCDEGDSSGR